MKIIAIARPRMLRISSSIRCSRFLFWNIGLPSVLFFFFQAEDGIRDHCVTGVQTCALPISGETLVQSMGGLHRFTTWTGPMLTDSGGFQVFSLEGLRRIEEHGVEFQSHIDGTLRVLTPERVMEIQWQR